MFALQDIDFSLFVMYFFQTAFVFVSLLLHGGDRKGGGR